MQLLKREQLVQLCPTNYLKSMKKKKTQIKWYAANLADVNFRVETTFKKIMKC